MITIDEGKLRVVFDPSVWTALKWDEHAAYVHGISKLNGELTDSATQTKRPEGSKAVDILACDTEYLYFIELKDFRGFTEQNAYRQESELPLEIGLKVRDTLAALAGVRATGHHAATVGAFVDALSRRLPIRVLAWLAEDAPSGRDQRKKRSVRDMTRSMELERRLQWLTRQAWVDDPLAPSLELAGVQIRKI